MFQSSNFKVLFSTVMSSAYLATVLVTQSVIATPSSSDEHDLILLAIKDCNLVLSQKLNDQQVKLYTELRNQEFLIEKLEAPLQEFDMRSETLSEQIEELTSKAIVETEGTVFIDKILLEETEFLADELEDLVEQYQPDIDRITAQAEEIAEAADAFTDAIEPITEGLDYDNVSIRDLKKNEQWDACYSFK